MTHEELTAAIIGALVLIGLAGLGMVGIFKKLGFLKPPCNTACPDPDCKNQIIKAMGKTHEKVVLLEQGQQNVTSRLDNKRKQIAKIQETTTETKTDVKWIRSWIEKNGAL